MRESTALTTSPAALPSDLQQGRDRALARLIKPGELVWLIEDRYEAPTSSWLISLARQGSEARWLRQRYRYDSAVDVLFFLGERPLSDGELASARAAGKSLNSR